MMDRERIICNLEGIKEYFRKCRENVSFGSDEENKLFDLQEAISDAIALLKEQEAVEPYMDYDGHDVWRCGNCGATIFHIEHSHADEDWKSYAKFCRQCGKAVKWYDSGDETKAADENAIDRPDGGRVSGAGDAAGIRGD